MANILLLTWYRLVIVLTQETLVLDCIIHLCNKIDFDFLPFLAVRLSVSFFFFSLFFLFFFHSY